MATRASSVADQIGYLGGSVRGAAATTRLEILRAVETAVTALAALQQIVSGLNSVAQVLHERVLSLDASVSIDPDGRVVESVEAGEHSMSEVIEEIESQRQFAVQSTALDGEHKEALVSECDELLELYRQLNAILCELRWAVMEHDASVESEEPLPEFENVADLVKELREP